MANQADDAPLRGDAPESVAPDDAKRSPADFSNPPGIGRGACDDDELAATDATCDTEITAQVEDMFLEETKPGFGIPGYEGEEDGGG